MIDSLRPDLKMYGCIQIDQCHFKSRCKQREPLKPISGIDPHHCGHFKGGLYLWCIIARGIMRCIQAFFLSGFSAHLPQICKIHLRRRFKVHDCLRPLEMFNKYNPPLFYFLVQVHCPLIKHLQRRQFCHVKSKIFLFRLNAKLVPFENV